MREIDITKKPINCCDELIIDDEGYEKRFIRSKNDFEKALKNVLSSRKRSGIARMSCF